MKSTVNVKAAMHVMNHKTLGSTCHKHVPVMTPTHTRLDTCWYHPGLVQARKLRNVAIYKLYVFSLHHTQ